MQVPEDICTIIGEYAKPHYCRIFKPDDFFFWRVKTFDDQIYACGATVLSRKSKFIEFQFVWYGLSEKNPRKFYLKKTAAYYEMPINNKNYIKTEEVHIVFTKQDADQFHKNNKFSGFFMGYILKNFEKTLCAKKIKKLRQFF
jgi:hypothetical protein